MASSADSHTFVAGAGMPPSDSLGSGKKAGVAPPWNLLDTSAVPVVVAVGNPIMDADSWPALPALASPPPPPAAAAKSSPKAAPPPSTGMVMSPVSLGNPGAPGANPENETSVRNAAARRTLMMPTGDALENKTPSPELSPVYVPNARSNSGDHHQNGRFGSHPHGRGGSYGGGNRRGNGGGGARRGSEHHGGFDGQRRGGGRRDGHGPAHQQRGHQPMYIRAPPLAVVAGGPPPPPPFTTPTTPQTPPYGAPMCFPDMPQQVYYYAPPPPEGIQGLPFVHHPASPQAILIDPVQELLRQIHYYFSDDNLCKDIFLRQHMDDQGWVPLSLVAGFPKVKQLTNDIQFILGTVMLSEIVEVQVDKIRRRGTWEHWLLPKPSNSTSNGTSSGSMSPMTSNIDSLASQFQSIGLEGATFYTNMQNMPREALLTRSTTSVSLGYHATGLHHNGSGSLFGSKPSKNLIRSDTF